jgi:hypothetical protein
LNYRQLDETLRQEEYVYEAELGSYANAADRRAMFVDHVESLISRENAIWTNVHQQKEEPANNSQRRQVPRLNWMSRFFVARAVKSRLSQGSHLFRHVPACKE